MARIWRTMGMKCRVPVVSAVCLLLLLGSGHLSASDATDSAPTVSPEKLEKLVVRRFRYVDERLLSGKSAKTIEQSGNLEAMDMLLQARKRRDEISEWISAGRMEEAYSALQEVSRSIKEALQLSRAEYRSTKKMRDDMESARIANDAYFELVKKRGLESSGVDVVALLRQARQARAEADRLYSEGDLKGATDSYSHSTRLLKKATSIFRDLNQ